MGSDNWLAVLALGTLLIAIIAAIVHFGGFLKNRDNRASARNALIDDDKSATAVAREGGEGAAHEGKTLKERLDASAASAHPTTPTESEPRH